MSIDTAALLSTIDLAELVSRYVDLKPDGREFKGLCPFHADHNPSFYVVPAKGFVRCFSCGVHEDAIGFIQQIEGIGFVAACEMLGAGLPTQRARPPILLPEPPAWTPVMPVPEDAPAFDPAMVWNPKRDRWTKLEPTRQDAYRSADGRLLGYVLRCELDQGEKWTPTVTLCRGPDGELRWSLVPFPRPRPLMGLDQLAARPNSPVLVVEGEKKVEAVRTLLGGFVGVCWAGGAQGVRHTDWTPLHGRSVTCWPDADEPGALAMDEVARILTELNRAEAA